MYILKHKAALLMDNWFSANLIIGISKIAIYNNSIENSKNLNDVFLKYSSLVEIRQAQCIPTLNYKSNSKKFIRSLNDLLIKGEEFPHRCTIEILIFTDCYLNYVDKYKMIAVTDQDEVIFPRKHSVSYPITNNFSYLDHSKGIGFLTQIFKNQCNSYNPSLILP